MIDFKNGRIRDEWKSTNPIAPLRLVVEHAWSYAAALDWTLLLTCVWRSHAEDRAVSKRKPWSPGPHCRWGAVDARTHGIEREKVRELVDELNEEFVYDPRQPGKPVAIFENVGTSDEHIHIQATLRTTRRAAA